MRRSAMLRVLIFVLAGFAALAAASSAQAKNTSCSFTITNLTFGTVDLTQNTTFDTTATLTASCTGANNVAVRICPNINAGVGGSTTGSPRFMKSGTNTLNFDLYQDAARTTIWGSYLWSFSGTYPAPTINLTLNSSGTGSTTATIYGRVQAGQQALPPGSYSSAFSGTNTQIAYDNASTGTCAQIGNANAKTAAFTVSATYSAVCTISATTLNFGSAGVLAAAVNASGSLSTTCSATTPYTIGLNGGNAGATDPTQRKMANGTKQVTYGLYRDSVHTQPWGSTSGTNTASGTGTGSAQGFTVFGQVPAQTTPAPGNYTDTVIATLTY